jgi:hypothetical protein
MKAVPAVAGLHAPGATVTVVPPMVTCADPVPVPPGSVALGVGRTIALGSAVPPPPDVVGVALPPATREAVEEGAAEPSDFPLIAITASPPASKMSTSPIARRPTTMGVLLDRAGP